MLQVRWSQTLLRDAQSEEQGLWPWTARPSWQVGHGATPPLWGWLDTGTAQALCPSSACSTGLDLPSHVIFVTDLGIDEQNPSAGLRWSPEHPVGAGNPPQVLLGLASKQQLHGDLAEHQVPVEKLQKAARALLEIQGEPAPDRGHIQETTGTGQSSSRAPGDVV